MDTKVTQLTRLTQRAHEYFPDHAGVTFDALVGPVDPALPAGRSVRGTTTYDAIERARRQDDPSVPMGGWDRSLKMADWDKVSALAADALRRTSKDLQLGAWLFEAQVNKSGFSALAPCLLLLHTLCERYWDELYPLVEDGNLGFRANIIAALQARILPAVRLLPITGCEREREYGWADWEQVRRNEQALSVLGRMNESDADTVTGAQLKAAVAGTPTNAYAWLREMLADALDALEIAARTFDRCFGSDGPGLGELRGLLELILALVDGELQRRGVSCEAQVAWQPQEPAEPREALDECPAPGAADGAILGRNDAYARLAQAAAYLMRIEPHSPAPYLVNRAVEWGRLDTSDLYHEMFVRLGGKLSIFELLGVQVTQSEQA